MILLDGMARSGTSLLGRLVALILEPRGYVYYYEPFKHPTPAGPLPNWEKMMQRVLAPSDADEELESYIRKMESGRPRGLFWKEIRLTLKQDWLLAQFPEMKIIHIVRDILGVFSSHRRSAAPDWMDRHRQIWSACLPEWKRQIESLRKKGVPHLELLERSAEWNEAEAYASTWTFNEGLIRELHSSRLMTVRYEDLCLRPIDILSNVAQFLGVPFDERLRQSVLEQISDSEVAHDPSGPGTGLPPEAMPEIWRQRLAPDEIDSILRVTDQVRRELEYPPYRWPSKD